MTDVIASGVTESEKRAIAYVNSLIEEAERLSNVASHPGRTKELVEWKNNVETYIQRVYGTASPIWGRYAKLIIIPNWFDEKKHGTPQAEDNRPVAIILSEMDIDAKNRTFQLYKESLQEIAAILKSVKNDIAVIGLPTKSNSSTSTPTNSFNTTIAPNFNQSQNQSQNQNANIKNSIQE